ncbi:hypothetical protein NDN08_001705 [Rhodosorus marinus]|uniref:Ribosomal protein L46 N-terminal domain-containing protein n=1 Tax=Rhodosorus marinus TaxID=101924 RepID=A0AAV8URM7_9RHOD|nr:hypothetical protein NDN08_001705 [Rhodosorus marinus]
MSLFHRLSSLRNIGVMVRTPETRIDRRWMSKLESRRRRVKAFQSPRNKPKYITPWQKEPQMKTFVQSRMSNKMRALLERQGALSDKPDPADSFEKGWIIASATVLTRAMVLEPELPQNIREYREKKFAKKNAKNKPLDRSVLEETGVLDTDKDVYFYPGSRETEADRRRDMRSVWRKLDKKLFFVFKGREAVKQYQFPQRVTLADETMRGSAKKALKLVAGSSIKLAHFAGHAPLAVYKRVFNEEQQRKTNAYGAKVFFYPAYLVDGDIRGLDQGYDFRWLTKEELQNFLAKDYFQAVKNMLA